MDTRCRPSICVIYPAVTRPADDLCRPSAKWWTRREGRSSPTRCTGPDANRRATPAFPLPAWNAQRNLNRSGYRPARRTDFVGFASMKTDPGPSSAAVASAWEQPVWLLHGVPGRDDPAGMGPRHLPRSDHHGCELRPYHALSAVRNVSGRCRLGHRIAQSRLSFTGVAVFGLPRLFGKTVGFGLDREDRGHRRVDGDAAEHTRRASAGLSQAIAATAPLSPSPLSRPGYTSVQQAAVHRGNAST